MTKEELEKEAEEKAKKRTKGFACQDNCEKSYVMGALDFAEPREKRIEELAKEKAELKADNDARKFAMAMSENVEKQLRKEVAELTKACDETQELLDKQIEATYKLDKENEELKAKYESVSIIAHNRGQFALSAMRENREYETKFTKAKKIIKTLADDLSMYSGNYQKELLEAKQFLNENEVEG